MLAFNHETYLFNVFFYGLREAIQKVFPLSRYISTVWAPLAVVTPAQYTLRVPLYVPQLHWYLRYCYFFNTFRVIVIAASFNHEVLSTHLLIVLLLWWQTRRKLSLFDQTRGEIFTGRLGCSIFPFTKCSLIPSPQKLI